LAWRWPVAKYCPYGDGVYEDWVERCPACGRPLRDTPPETVAGPIADDPIVPLTTAPNEPMAQMTAQVLLDEGIRALVKPKGPGYGAWGSVATFEHELFVLRSQLDRARAIVAELQAAEVEDDAWMNDED
jgi:hypothetical protein